MTMKFYDVIVPKEYMAKGEKGEEKKTAWNKIGRAWLSQSGESLSFELFMLPNQRYVIQLKQKDQDHAQANNEDTPF